jgi:hypothetical protein
MPVDSSVYLNSVLAFTVESNYLYSGDSFLKLLNLFWLFVYAQFDE